MSFYKIDDSILTSIADAIRSKTGSVDPIQTTSMAAEIMSISGGDARFKTEMEASEPYSIFDSDCTQLKSYCFYSDSQITSVDYENVISIGNYAFHSCSSLLTASFPACETLGSYAFSNCRSLTSFYGDNLSTINNYAFFGCSSLQAINLENVTVLGEKAFCNCISLTEVSFNQHITQIAVTEPSGPFYGCTRLSKATFGPNADVVTSRMFLGCSALVDVSIPTVSEFHTYAFAGTPISSIEGPSITYIGPNAFNNCISLTTVSFPILESITQNNTFSNCKSLNSVYIPQLKTLSSYIFYNCLGLTNIEFSQLTECGDGAFKSCRALTSVSLPELTKAGNYTFQYCVDLVSINLPKLKSTNGYIFSDCTSLATVNLPLLESTNAGAFYNCTALSEISLPNIFFLSQSMFKGCTSLKKVVLGANFSDTTSSIYGDIGQDAFYGCTQLSEAVNVSYGRYIGRNAFNGTLFSELCFLNLRSWSGSGQYFMNCTELATVSISGSVTKIYNQAFANCPKLTSLYLLATSMITLNASAANIFGSSPLQPGGLNGVFGSIYVPEDLYDSYIQNASWKAIETSHAGTFVSIPANSTT